MVRGAVGVTVGALVWMALFFALAFSLAALWPDYGVRGSHWFRDRTFDFTTVMAACNALIWVAAEVGGGLTTGVIAKRREPVWALAALLGVYLAYMHLYAEWAHLPAWYNLAVALPAAPAVLLGGRLALTARRPARA
jgi:hypothetical protein